jgi:hypothetical protein
MEGVGTERAEFGLVKVDLIRCQPRTMSRQFQFKLVLLGVLLHFRLLLDDERLICLV